MAHIDGTKERKYISLKQRILEDIKEYRIENKAYEERLEFAKRRVKDLNLSGEDEKIYITNMIILDEEEFLKLFIECEKKINICAKRLGVPQDYVVAKVYEISKYGIYEEKGDTKMSESGIIEITNPQQEVRKVDTETTKAIARINELFEKSKSGDQAIARQSIIIDRLNGQIAELEEEDRKKDQQIELLEARLTAAEIKLSNKEEQIQILEKYKEAYERVTGYLNNPEKEEKTTRQM